MFYYVANLKFRKKITWRRSEKLPNLCSETLKPVFQMSEDERLHLDLHPCTSTQKIEMGIPTGVSYQKTYLTQKPEMGYTSKNCLKHMM